MSPVVGSVRRERALFSPRVLTLRSFAAFFIWLRERYVPQVDAGHVFPYQLRSVSLFLSDLKCPNVSLLSRSRRASYFARSFRIESSANQVLFYMYIKLAVSFFSSLSLCCSRRTIGTVVETLLQRQCRDQRRDREKEIRIDGVDKVGYYLYASS